MDTLYVMFFLDGAENLTHTEKDLHVTLLARVETPNTETTEQFLHRVEELAMLTEEFIMNLGELAAFGANEDMLVRKLDDPTYSAKAFHLNLLAAAYKTGITSSENPNYLGLGFEAHITLSETTELPLDTILVNSVQVVEHRGGFGSGVVKLLADFDLKKKVAPAV